MKKRITVVAIAFAMSIAGTTVSASGMAIPESTQMVDTQESRIKDLIEYKYRYHNGVVQYRRWNSTQGYWVDPDWIDLTEK